MPQLPSTRSGTLHFQGINVTLIVDSAISYCWSGVLRDLINSLKEIGIAKNKQKELNDPATQETWRIKICEKAEVEKKRLDIKKELRVFRLVLEKK